MTWRCRTQLAGVVALAAGRFIASASVHGQTIPVRDLTPVEAITTRKVRAILGDVRETPDAKLLVNDAGAKQLVLFDRGLQSMTVLRDSVPGREDSYGPRASFLIPYLADSSLFVDIASRTLVVVAPEGMFTRTMAIPNPRDIGWIAAPGTSVDAQGRLIYRGDLPPRPVPVDGRPPSAEPVRDSVPLLRADFDARRVDTIAKLKVAASDKHIVTGEGNNRRSETIVNPLHSIDNWAVLSNGTVALVRGFNYHVDWIGATEQRTSSAKMPFAWRQLTDTEKERLIDSARAFRRKRDSVTAAAAATNPGLRTRIEIRDGSDVSVADLTTYVTSFVPLGEIPDYYPPLRDGATRADRENHLWILPTTTVASLNGELVYDVINEQGELFERVRVPAGRSIAGFGKGGAIYLMQRVDNGWVIERRRVVR